jgi:hypothetical protein
MAMPQERNWKELVRLIRDQGLLVEGWLLAAPQSTQARLSAVGVIPAGDAWTLVAAHYMHSGDQSSYTLDILDHGIREGMYRLCTNRLGEAACWGRTYDSLGGVRVHLRDPSAAESSVKSWLALTDSALVHHLTRMTLLPPDVPDGTDEDVVKEFQRVLHGVVEGLVIDGSEGSRGIRLQR